LLISRTFIEIPKRKRASFALDLKPAQNDIGLQSRPLEDYVNFASVRAVDDHIPNLEAGVSRAA
jgi:hypothetical protein